MIRFKGRLSIRQYLPNKPTKWGIKQYFLCESKTGYALKFIAYCGRGTIPVLESFSTIESIVLSLLDGNENHDHIVYTDNFYSSPRLFKELERLKIEAWGTVKPGRKDMPSDLHPKNLNLDRGDMPVVRRTENLMVWHKACTFLIQCSCQWNCWEKKTIERNCWWSSCYSKASYRWCL